MHSQTSSNLRKRAEDFDELESLIQQSNEDR